MTAPTGLLLGTFSAPENKARRRFMIWGVLFAVGISAMLIGNTLITGGSTGSIGGVLFCGGGLGAFVAFMLALVTLPYIFRRGAVIHVHQDGFALHDLKTNAVKRAALWTEIDDIIHPHPATASYVVGEGIGAVGGQFGLIGSIIGGLLSSAVQDSGSTNIAQAGAPPKTPMTIKQKSLPGIVLDNSYGDFHTMFTHIHDATQTAWYDQAMARIDQQEACAMGAFEVDDRRIVLRQNRVLWSHVTSAAVETKGPNTFFFVYYTAENGRNKQFSANIGKKGDVLWRVVDTMRKRERDARQNR